MSESRSRGVAESRAAQGAEGADVGGRLPAGLVGAGHRAGGLARLPGRRARRVRTSAVASRVVRVVGSPGSAEAAGVLVSEAGAGSGRTVARFVRAAFLFSWQACDGDCVSLLGEHPLLGDTSVTGAGLSKQCDASPCVAP